VSTSADRFGRRDRRRGGRQDGRRRGHRRGGSLVTVLVALLVIVPIVEIAVLVAVGRAIGGWQTLALLLVESALGAWLVRREGARAWTALVGALRTGRMPSRELTDAALVLVGGTLLLTPGFVTDVVGFAFVLPVTRPLARGLLVHLVERRLLAGLGPLRPTTGYGRGYRGDDPHTVRGTVLDREPPPDGTGQDSTGRTG
jgi:UPF0716 protein FxsA